MKLWKISETIVGITPWTLYDCIRPSAPSDHALNTGHITALTLILCTSLHFQGSLYITTLHVRRNLTTDLNATMSKDQLIEKGVE